MLYRIARPLLFALDGEQAHTLTLGGLELARAAGAARLLPAAPRCPRRVMGLDFPNPVGLAAGLDKNGDHVDALGALGFGFIEIGTVTPRPQPGNPRPRLFRLVRERALINRMGFNNLGVAHLAARAAAARYTGVLGINIGKNADTPIERATEDYLECLRAVHAHADYVAVNISSPNTAALRELQHGQALDTLLGALQAERAALAARDGRRVPLAVKIAPDLDEAALDDIAAAAQRHALDALIATNTTLAREGVIDTRGPHAGERGGLSGAPLRPAALRVVQGLRRRLPHIALIGVGGIQGADDAQRMMEAGADLVQLYTGLIYQGPALVREVAAALCRR